MEESFLLDGDALRPIVRDLAKRVESTEWGLHTASGSPWYLDALAAVAAAVHGRTIQYVTAQWSNPPQGPDTGELLVFASGIVVVVTVEKSARLGAPPSTRVSVHPRSGIVSLDVEAPLTHYTSSRRMDQQDAFQGWGVSRVAVDYGNGRSWLLPLDGPPRNADARTALTSLLPQLLSDFDR